MIEPPYAPFMLTETCSGKATGCHSFLLELVIFGHMSDSDCR